MRMLVMVEGSGFRGKSSRTIRSFCLSGVLLLLLCSNPGFAVSSLDLCFIAYHQADNAVVWTFGLAFVLSLLAPTLSVWALYRFWMYGRWVRASAL
jgi:hypothetical protein